MLNLLSQGGPVFMGILTLILLSLVVVFLLSLKHREDEFKLTKSIQWLKSIGTLGLVVGILGQLVGLYGAFAAIETSQGFSPTILAGGIKITMITTIYGIVIYIIHLACTMVLKRLQV